MNATQSASSVAEPMVLITRLYDAPRELVFRAWTDPKHLLKWFAPNGCTLEIKRWDARAGGTFHTCISNPSFGSCWCTGTYREVVAPERIVFTMVSADADGKPLDPVKAGHDPEWPAETVVTVTLADEGGKTRLTLQQTVSEKLAKKTGAHPSWLQMLDRLAGELKWMGEQVRN